MKVQGYVLYCDAGIGLGCMQGEVSGYVLYCDSGYGVAGAGRRMKASTGLRVASIRKPVTAIAVLRLCQEGRLSLDAKVFGTKGECDNSDQQFEMLLTLLSLSVNTQFDRVLLGWVGILQVKLCK